MCILFIAVNQHRDYPLIIAANRDEFHRRPTSVSNFWYDHKNILAGRDLSAGGTWMGINRAGKVAALTNIRAPREERPNAKTRGELVVNYLHDDICENDYLHQLQQSHLDYNGYNLLFGTLDNLLVYNNFDNTVFKLGNGVYGLSNATLDSPWPKLDAGKAALANYCQGSSDVSYEHLFTLLSNTETATDDILPQTGVPLEWERMLSSIFIKNNFYGTRSSTILLLNNDNHCYWEERSYDPKAEITNKQIIEFDI